MSEGAHPMTIDERAVAVSIASEWLERQKATNRVDDCLDEGDCRTCGYPAGEGHEPTDPCGIIAGLLAALDSVHAVHAEGHWQPIETFPTASMGRPDTFWFWVVPKTADESYTDTSGNPIVRTHAPYLHRGTYKSWSALSKATHWQREPASPAVITTREPR